MKILTRFMHSTAYYLIIHFFLNLTSLPIMLAWGLPISYLSPLGNFIFNPLIFVFLFLSSAIFFCEIAYIPHGIVNWLLEQTTKLWQWMLTFHGPNPLCALSTPPFFLLLALAAAPFIIFMHPAIRSIKRRLLWLMIITGIAMISIRITTRQHPVTILECHGGSVTLMQYDHANIIIDPGCIGKRISAPSWVAYTLVPALAKHTGKLTIDHLILLKPGIRLFEALRPLCDTVQVRNIYVPYLYGTMPPSLGATWGKLRRALLQQECIIHRINTGIPIDICINDHVHFSIEPYTQESYRTMKYAKARILGRIDNKSVTIYDQIVHPNQSLRSSSSSYLPILQS